VTNLTAPHPRALLSPIPDGFGPTKNSAIQSADPETREPNMNWIGWPHCGDIAVRNFAIERSTLVGGGYKLLFIYLRRLHWCHILLFATLAREKYKICSARLKPPTQLGYWDDKTKRFISSLYKGKRQRDNQTLPALDGRPHTRRIPTVHARHTRSTYPLQTLHRTEPYKLKQ